MQQGPTRGWRRTVLAGVLGAALVGCESTSAPEHVPGPGQAESALSAQVNRDLAMLRGLTAPFHRIDRAVEAGYDARVTPCWYHRELGAQGEHHGRPALIPDGAVSLLEPELLMYEPQVDGSLRLAGVEYIVPVGDWQGESPPELLGQEFHVNEALGLYVLHVWLWRHNPAGLFADWNPDVTCEHAADAEDRAP